ncbi:MAG: SIR2 family protein [Zoogloeaceae bacterium]|nr:SIR2 family protein [Zoogloeaceae bacterium]
MSLALSSELRAQIIDGIRVGNVVPYLGCGALEGVVATADGAPMPADSDSLILAMNDGKPMSPKLMYEFSRAAMHVELKRGRGAVEKFLTRTYGEKTAWTRSRLHDWLRDIRPPYVIDINRDTQLQDSYADVPHILIVGLARIGGSDFRFKLFRFETGEYREIQPEAAQEAIDQAPPILFKPMGSPRPRPYYVASDADYVDYLTELMGGFGVPAFVKQIRVGKRYLLLGLRLVRDTERMVLADIIHNAANPAGWAFIPDATDKERRFCEKLRLQIIDTGWEAMLTNETLATA